MDQKEIMNIKDFPYRKSIGLLLDPDKAKGEFLERLLEAANKSRTDYILAGGSLSFNGIDKLIENVRQRSSLPVILFPGNLLQLSLNADAIFFLSLISGRNPELLIGNHVIAAPYLKESKNKIIPVGYILISCGNKTSVEYISQTEAIPSDKPDIAIATALAGEMLGLRLIYLEAGSGSSFPVPLEIINSVKDNITVPLAVGGGIKNGKEIEEIFNAGADLVILGNSCEKNPDLLYEACSIRDKIRKTQYPLV
jgi:phosphoglycerol geranylgeranyltransferase